MQRAAPIAETGPELKKQELLEKLVDRADVQKKLAKPVLDAVLELLGEALAEGRDLNLPPLGKIKVNRVKDMAQARVIVAKIRQSKAESSAAAEVREMEAKVAVAEDLD
jgi:DNA-binding protein HU-alpha